MNKLLTDKSIFDSSDFVFCVDEQEYFLEANDALLTEAGYKRESDILGKTCLELQLPWSSAYQKSS